MNASTLFLLGLVLGAVAVFVLRAAGQDGAASSPPVAHAHEGAEPMAQAAPPSDARAAQPTNALCPVQGDPVDPDVFIDHEGRRIWFCCPGCDEIFLQAPERYQGRLDRPEEAR